MPKHFMRIRDLGHSGAWEIIRRAKEMKETNYRGHCMDGKVAALIFEKASTRTRVSFDVAVRQLGGTTIFMTPAESQLGRSEPLRDTARVLSRYVDCLIVRTFGQEKLDELAEYGSLPVVNALTDQGHPCQLMADLLTIYERTPDFSKVTVTWVGDGNNMANSWIEAAMYFPFQLNMAIAPGYEPDQQLLALALQSGAKIFLTHAPKLAVDGANYNLIAELPTDVQFANENADLYRSMSNDFSAILKSLTFSKGVTRTEVTAPTQTSGSGS